MNNITFEKQCDLYDSVHIVTLFDDGTVMYRKGILLRRTENYFLLVNSTLDKYISTKFIIKSKHINNPYRAKYNSAIIICPIVLIEKSTQKQLKN